MDESAAAHPASAPPHEEDSGGHGVPRRSVMVYGLAAATLTLAVPLGGDTPSEAGTARAPTPGGARPSDVVVIGTDDEKLVLEVTTANRVVVRLPRVEVGQGITTAVAMLIADELDARLADVDIPLADARRDGGSQSTGGSNSVRSLYDPARHLAATARARLVTAAARRWRVPARTLRTRDTMVIAPDGRKATFGSLSAAAARITRPAVPSTPKPARARRVVGLPAGRIDGRDLVTGKAKYAGDLAVAGAKPTVVARPPRFGAEPVSVDDSAARAMPGVLAVVKIPSGVAVVAETFHHAFKARNALRIEWSAGPIANVSDQAIRSWLRAAVPPLPRPRPGTSQVTAEFEFAFVSHAPMEVLTAVADVRAGRAELWFSTQTPVGAQAAIAEEIGLPERAVRVHVMRGGGSFGRRLTFEAAIEAAQISKAALRPVKLMWSRYDDMRHGRMRPATHHRVRASHAGGRVVAFTHHTASVSEGPATTSAAPAAMPESDGAAEFDGAAVATAPDTETGAGRTGLLTEVAAAAPLPSDTGLYNFGAVSENSGSVSLPIPLGAWRSVDSGTTRTAEEIVVDEVARALRADPVAFRRMTLRGKAVRAVLDKVATAGRWGRPLPSGWGQGVAVHEEYESCVACLAEIDATDPRNPRVVAMVMAADVGTVINPNGLRAQLMGTAIDGISTILRAGLHIDGGAVREGSFADFHYARQRHSPPRFEAHLMPSGRRPGGAGELGVPAAAGAVANAYARATGTSPRRFPINF